MSDTEMPPPSVRKSNSLFGDIFGCTDAATAKLSCIGAGYYYDPYLHQFTTLTQSRSRLINRGYFARIYSILRCVSSFCKGIPGNKQVVFLGAGFDSYLFTMKEDDHPGLTLWMEVDLPEVVMKKNEIYSQHAKRENFSRYKLISGDLLDGPGLIQSMKDGGLDPSIPTIYLLECVTAYLPPEANRSILNNISQLHRTAASPAMVVGYDPMSQQTDNFGKVMVANLMKRGIEMPSLMAFPTTQSREDILRETGFDSVQAINMKNAYMNIPPPEKARIDSIEPLDEFEEFFLLLSHYCVWIGRIFVPDTIGAGDETLSSLIPPEHFRKLLKAQKQYSPLSMAMHQFDRMGSSF
ncbi:putative Leucine carboxyl methyltransferase 1 [Blattamonas nauphoetae]|uniref:[phosphatase 2A protein]-leucine-carboxy methyltransferase n=1 Tax=Blattamonas nauphoetae TaxID=2049346 RepID=A0ABQ9YHX2_9EUKA|nr:putative Leucine carboxyl methyltransferase 1 [Blattamonas nauphoetae]